MVVPAGSPAFLRHELVHVALASRADRLRVWLSEALAEYRSVQTPGRPSA